MHSLFQFIGAPGALPAQLTVFLMRQIPKFLVGPARVSDHLTAFGRKLAERLRTNRNWAALGPTTLLME
eukprot:157097-Pyramimonas_sp.AAC.1